RVCAGGAVRPLRAVPACATRRRRRREAVDWEAWWCRSWVHRSLTGTFEREEVLVPTCFERAEEVEADLFDAVEPATVDLDDLVVVATGGDSGGAVGDAGLPQERADESAIAVEVDLEVGDEVPERGESAVGEAREERAHLLFAAR